MSIADAFQMLCDADCIELEMARGWESKGVEEQLAERENAAVQRDSAAPGLALARAAKQRARNELQLQREGVLNQRTSNPHRRSALAAALAQIEQQLAALGED